VEVEPLVSVLEKATGWTDGSGKRYISGKNKTSRWTKTRRPITTTPGGQLFRRRQQWLPKVNKNNE